jgi:hypothetical protein
VPPEQRTTIQATTRHDSGPVKAFNGNFELLDCHGIDPILSSADLEANLPLMDAHENVLHIVKHYLESALEKWSCRAGKLYQPPKSYHTNAGFRKIEGPDRDPVICCESKLSEDLDHKHSSGTGFPLAGGTRAAFQILDRKYWQRSWIVAEMMLVEGMPLARGKERNEVLHDPQSNNTHSRRLNQLPMLLALVVPSVEAQPIETGSGVAMNLLGLWKGDIGAQVDHQETPPIAKYGRGGGGGRHSRPMLDRYLLCGSLLVCGGSALVINNHHNLVMDIHHNQDCKGSAIPREVFAYLLVSSKDEGRSKLLHMLRVSLSGIEEHTILVEHAHAKIMCPQSP